MAITQGIMFLAKKKQICKVVARGRMVIGYEAISVRRWGLLCCPPHPITWPVLL